MDNNLPLYRFVFAVTDGLEKLHIFTTAPTSVQAKYNICAQLRAIGRAPANFREFARRKQQLIRGVISSERKK